MEQLLPGFHIENGCVQLFARDAQLFNPGFVFGAKLFFQFLAQALCERWTLAIRRNRDLKITAIYYSGVIEVAIVRIVDRVAENIAQTRFLKNV
jgi:hypothetical protein